MSTQILIKRSTTTGAIPTTADIAVGELAVNTTDKRIFTNNSGTIVELGTTPTTQAVTGNASVGGTFDVVGAVTVGNLTADGTVDLTSATVTIPAPTADTHPATKKYVDDEVNAILDGAPAALDTLNEIAAAINDDANLYTTLTTSIATKLSLAGGTMTGSIDMGANSVTTSADPATDNTLTRKSYVDGLYQSTVDAEVSAAAALASEQAAATSASNASTSASASATSATASASSATNAASSATAAASSATSSANSATASATSATQSAASATAAQALVDSIEVYYLGAEASAPTTDDNGDPLQAGAWYFNTTDDNTYIYNGSSWQTVSPDLVSDTTPQLGGNLDTNGNDITFGDNDKAVFGAGSDLQIYHDGSNSYIADTGTGFLTVSSGTDLILKSAGGEKYLHAVGNAEVSLYHNGSGKLSTTSTGVDVTGTVTADGLTVDGTTDLNIGTANIGIDMTSTDDGSYIQIKDNNATGFYFGARAGSFDLYDTDNSAILKANSNGDISFYEDTGTTAKFFWDASAESLGIGTSSPDANFVVHGSGSPEVKLYNTSATANDSHSFIIRGYNNTSTIWNRLNYSASSHVFDTYGAERMRIDSSGNVGIGTSSPSVPLQVKSTDSRIWIEDFATSQTLELGSSNTQGYVYNRANTPLTFGTNNTERMRIDSSGNLLVGTTNTYVGYNNTNTGINLQSDLILASRNDSNPMVLNRNNTDGGIVDFRKNGSTVGSIGTSGGYTKLISGNSTYGSGLQMSNLALHPVSAAGSVSNGAMDIGGSTERFKDLYLSGGVYLGGTGAANHLDDYEEGTFTPTITFGGGSTGITYNASYNRGWYTIIGRVVVLKIALEVQSKGSSTGAAKIQVPFASSLTAASHAQKVHTNKVNAVSTAAYGTAGSADFALYKSVASTSVNQSELTDSDFGSTFSIVASLTYMI